MVNLALTLLLDGSLDTRTEAKRTFAVLKNSPHFEERMEFLVENRQDLDKARKTIEQIEKVKEEDEGEENGQY